MPPAAPEKSWNVVLFSDGGLGIVPENWLDQPRKTCKYPNVNTFVLHSLIEACAEPAEAWKMYKIDKYYHEKLDSFAEAKGFFNSIDSEMSGAEAESDSGKKSNPTVPLIPPVRSPFVETSKIDTSSKKRKKSSAVNSVEGSPACVSGSTPNPNSANHNLSNAKNGSDDPNPNAANHSVSGSTPNPNSANHNLSNAKNGSDDPNPNAANHNSRNAGNGSEQPNPNSANHNSTENGSANESSQHSTGTNSCNQLPTDLRAGNVSAPNAVALVRQLVGLIAGREPGAMEQREEVPTQSVPDTEPPESILDACPLQNMDQFNKFERQLKKSRSMRNKLRDEYKLFLTNDKKTSCRNCLKQTMSDDLAANFSWKGQNSKVMASPKKAFEGTQVHRLILQTVNIKFKDNKMTMKDFQDYLSDWLTMAKFRLQRKAERSAARAARLAEMGHPADLQSSDSSDESSSEE